MVSRQGVLGVISTLGTWDEAVGEWRGSQQKGKVHRVIRWEVEKRKNNGDEVGSSEFVLQACTIGVVGRGVKVAKMHSMHAVRVSITRRRSDGALA